MRWRGSALLATVAACLAAAPALSQTIDDGQANTLKEALAKAYDDNPTLEAARANQRATDANVPIERADMLPSLSGQATLTEFLKQAPSSFTSPQKRACSPDVPICAAARARCTARWSRPTRT